uniref:FCH and double SH3 domains 2 n=1 Tax=Oncorhynchus kisutch TaxID=8019 RepID=A0A8C7L0M0_ONCKI
QNDLLRVAYKVKVTQELKQTHAEQISRLHIKHQTECDLLEDLRTFSQKKAAIERDYAQVSISLSVLPSLSIYPSGGVFISACGSHFIVALLSSALGHPKNNLPPTKAPIPSSYEVRVRLRLLGGSG